MQCTNSHCLYEWTPRRPSPVACPKCRQYLSTNVLKVRHFLSVHAGKLQSNEYLHKFDIMIDGRKTTYNPDFYSPEDATYIEVTTSANNIMSQSAKWRETLRLGHPLKVYWWEGAEITELILNGTRAAEIIEAANRKNGKKGGRPKKQV